MLAGQLPAGYRPLAQPPAQAAAAFNANDLLTTKTVAFTEPGKPAAAQVTGVYAINGSTQQVHFFQSPVSADPTVKATQVNSPALTEALKGGESAANHAIATQHTPGAVPSFE